MKILIACYSRTGKTLNVAESLKQKLGADFTRIEPVKLTGGPIGWLSEGRNAASGKRVPIKPAAVDFKAYDLIVFCCPVFAGSTPGGVNEYLAQVRNSAGKKYAVLVTSGGDRPQKASLQIKEFMDKGQGQFMGLLHISGKDLKTGEAERKVQEFAASLAK